MTNSPNVTQADRDAVEAFWKERGPFRMGTTTTLAEAFARHREQTTAAIVAWLREECERGVVVRTWNLNLLADAIERGEHIAAQEPTNEQ